MSIKYLADFYAEMRFLREARCKIISDYKSSSHITNVFDLKDLNKIEKRLKSIQKKDGLFVLKTHQEDDISLELDYELGEIQKDKIYLEHGENALLDYLEKLHPNFNKEIDRALNFFKNQAFNHFITDRDGTISNYCGRYQSSVQSIYNALFLSSFTKEVKGKSIIITSAPLYNIGLADISIQPKGDFILAGSKGREFIDENNQKVFYPIEEKQQEKLKELNKAIDKLLNQPEYSSFRYIGSGLQLKFGQTAIARQDKNNSIPKQLSLDLKQDIEDLLQELDPDNKCFRLEDTGRDLEIMLTVENDNQNKDFDKGHGLQFIAKKLNLKTENQNLLVCGDTASDLPLIKAANELNANVFTVFVTTDEDLKAKVHDLSNNALIVSNPDILVTSLYLHSK